MHLEITVRSNLRPYLGAPGIPAAHLEGRVHKLCGLSQRTVS